MFKLIHSDGKARIGRLKTKHGIVETPLFMPVATKGAVKLIDTSELKEMNVQGIISNAFLLSLKPGLDIAKDLHKFMDWNRVIFTDSGGFQILSMNNVFKGIKKNGINFKNPFNGEEHLLTPEKVMEIQKILGSDVAMALDHMPLYGLDFKKVKEAVEDTHRWAEICLEKKNEKQLLFGIAQGGIYPELRKKSTEFINSLDFDGVALGGLCIGESKEDMHKMIKLSIPLIKDKPRYLMGVGSPVELINCIGEGIDVFDSVFPTRNARHGHIITKKGAVNIENSEYRKDFSALDENCKCKVCRKYSKAYINHLFNSTEYLGLRLATYHNLFFIQNLIKEVKKAIKEKNFEKFKKEFIKNYKNEHK